MFAGPGSSPLPADTAPRAGESPVEAGQMNPARRHPKGATVNRPVTLDRFMPELDAFTRPELVTQYTQVERHRERTRTGRRDWTDRIPLEDGRTEVRRYEAGRLVSREFVMPSGSAHQRTQRGTYGMRLG